MHLPTCTMFSRSSAKLFGFKRSPPPFLYLLTLAPDFQKHLYRGVNFASGGAGLLDITGKNLVIIYLHSITPMLNYDHHNALILLSLLCHFSIALPTDSCAVIRADPSV